MDRLQALTRLALLGAILTVAGCNDDGSSTTAAPPSRVVAVTQQGERDPAEGFCEAAVSGDGAPALALPALAPDTAAPAPSGKRRWVNVWATWCQPCIEEMPRLVEWSDRLREDGADVEIVFVSADADAETVTRFRAEHENLPESVRVADPAGIASWATTVGLDEGATLPMHVFADDRNRVRCARTGGVGDRDYEAVRAVVRRM